MIRMNADCGLSEARITRIFCQNRGFSPNQRYECHLGIPRIIFVSIAEDDKSATIEWLWIEFFIYIHTSKEHRDN